MKGFNILATADLHGFRRAYKDFTYFGKRKEIDLIVIAGDLTSYENQNEEEIKDILKSIHKPILFVMGNDDEFAWNSESNLVNINQRRYELSGFNFVGYQYTNPFVGGIFEKSEDEQQLDFDELQNIVDKNTILVTHGPCFEILDSPRKNENVGSKALLRFYMRTTPKLHIFGHIHESFGVAGAHYNVSYPKLKSFIKIDIVNDKYEILN